MSLRAQGTNDDTGGFVGGIQDQGRGNDNGGVGGGQVIDDASEGLETTTEAAGA